MQWECKWRIIDAFKCSVNLNVCENLQWFKWEAFFISIRHQIDREAFQMDLNGGDDGGERWVREGSWRWWQSKMLFTSNIETCDAYNTQITNIK